MTSKSQKSKMPEGKMQFGIIVPVDVHKVAAEMASATIGTTHRKRISDIYSEGVMELQRQAKGSHPESKLMAAKFTKGVDKRDWPLFEALGEFLRSNPRQNERQMLELVLGAHLSAAKKRPD